MKGKSPQRHERGWRRKAWSEEIYAHRYLLLLSLAFLLVASVLDVATGIYTTRVGGVVAPDLILDHVQPVDLEYIFTYGYLACILVLFAYPLFYQPSKLHIVISQFSLLVLVRGFFMIFTHLKAPVDAVVVKFPWLLSHLSFQNDLFFSGHVAVPFLGFLLFRDQRLKWFFLVSSIIMGITVLLMHIHYSIDVLSAFFITFGTFTVGNWLFSRPSLRPRPRVQGAVKAKA